MGEPAPSRATAAAAAASPPDDSDEAIARKLHVMEQLVHVFGFPQDRAGEAIDAVGFDDVTACCEYLLDHGEVDKGGPIAPITTCPHVTARVRLSVNQLPLCPQACACTYFRDNTTASSAMSDACEAAEDKGASKSAGVKAVTTDDGKCPAGENWLCLHCGKIRCSRYVNAHGVAHWKETKQLDSIDGFGHCIALSLEDFSVWCHVCGAYIQHPSLSPILRQIEALKFPQEMEPATNDEDVCPSTPPRKAKKARSMRSIDLEVGKDSAEIQMEASQTVSSEEEGEESADDGSPDPHDDSDMLEVIRAAAAARGIPFEWLLHEVQAEESDIEYPFESLPSSLEELAAFISSPNCRSVLVLAGAGMSVAAGIPDFRSADGLYSTMNADLLSADEEQRRAMRLDPTVALDQHLFLRNPLPCLELNREFILGTRDRRWKATLAHRFVELLHLKTNKLVRLYTQNIDGLEDQCTQLPQEKVVNVHGSMDRAECATCHSEGDMEAFAEQVKTQIKDLSQRDSEAPEESTAIDCTVCGSNTMKPAIVLFRSSLPRIFFERMPDDTAEVDLLIVIGTSLRVAPANSIVWRVPKSTLRVLVNREPEGMHLGMDFDPSESKRDYFAQGECEKVLLELMGHLGWLDDLAPLLDKHQLPDPSASLLREHLRLGRESATNTSTSSTSDEEAGSLECPQAA